MRPGPTPDATLKMLTQGAEGAACHGQSETFGVTSTTALPPAASKLVVEAMIE
jgi:hypothetical protein